MGINSYNAPTTPPIHNLLATVASGLDVASKIQGMKMDSEKLDAFRREQSRTQKQEAEEDDPNSPLAQSFRESADNVGITLPDTITPAQLKKNSLLFGQIEALTKSQQEQKNKLAEIAAKGAEDRKTEGLKLTKGDKPNGDQSKAALFGRQMEQAEQVFSKLGEQGFDPTSTGSAVQRFGLFPEGMKGDLQKQQAQAEENFVNAYLRRVSGAAISQSEFKHAESQFFPRIGDSPDVIEQKRQNRELAKEGLRLESGAAWDKYNAIPTQIAQTKTKSNPNKSSLINEAQAEQPSTVIQNGHLYILNPKTGKYE